MSKRIVHISYDFFSYCNAVSSQLMADGCEVTDFIIKRPKVNAVKKYYYRKKSIQYVIESQNAYVENKIIPYLKENRENIDAVMFSLIYLNDNYLNEIKNICSNAKLILILMDDYSILSDETANNLKLYDSIITYSYKDAENNGFIYNPNFYDREYSNKKIYDWSFIGTNGAHRKKVIDYICSSANTENAYIHIYKGSGTGIKDYIKCDILNNPGAIGSDKYLKCKSLSQEKTCEIFSMSKCIMDINNPKQNGLSFRPFHAMSMHTKVITTNEDIVNYDFYNPDNIYIMDFDNPILPPKEFFDSPYKELPAEIFEKYSLKSWCKRLEEQI